MTTRIEIENVSKVQVWERESREGAHWQDVSFLDPDGNGLLRVTLFTDADAPGTAVLKATSDEWCPSGGGSFQLHNVTWLRLHHLRFANTWKLYAKANGGDLVVAAREVKR